MRPRLSIYRLGGRLALEVRLRLLHFHSVKLLFRFHLL